MNTPSDLETLLGYAERFLHTMRLHGTLEEFRIYLKNLGEDAITLSNADASERILGSIEQVRKCDYVFRNDPELLKSLIVPAIERLVEKIGVEVTNAKKM